MKSNFNSGLQSSRTYEWGTPDPVFREIDFLYGPFTLDPCATPENARAAKFYTLEQNGLEQDWAGERVFMNPPYGKEIGKWIRKASYSDCYAVCLIPARTDTGWWQDYIGNGMHWTADMVRFWRGRITFQGAKYNAPFPSAVVIFK